MDAEFWALVVLASIVTPSGGPAVSGDEAGPASFLILWGAFTIATCIRGVHYTTHSARGGDPR